MFTLKRLRNISLILLLSSSYTSYAVGYDYSTNKPAIPVVGSSFSTGIYSSYVFINSFVANNTKEIEIINTSGMPIVIVLDDGTAAIGTAPNNASVFQLSGGSGVGSQGGSWNSTTFKGRVQIYAPSALAQVLARVA